MTPTRQGAERQRADLDFTTAIRPVDPAANIFGLDGWYVWCGTPISGPDGRYYLFYSRWPHGTKSRLPGDETLFDGFPGWMKYSEIAVATSEQPLGPYTHLRTVLRGSGQEARWDRFNAHNPHIQHFENRYFLYYIATNPVAGQPSEWLSYHGGQRIGVITADSLDELAAGGGQRSDAPLVAPDGLRTFQMAVNPSVTRGPGGDYVMTYKSWNARQEYITVIATAPTSTGPFSYAATALDTTRTQAEDPYLWYDRERARYYAIVKDFYPGTD